MKEPSKKQALLSVPCNQIKPISSFEPGFSCASCKAGSQKDLAEEELPAPATITTERQSRLKRFLNHFDDFSGWLFRKLLPKHLTKSPPPDRQIYY